MGKMSYGILLLLVSVSLLFTQTIKVTQPAKGKVYQHGQMINIEWTSSGISGNVGIALVKTDQRKRYLINLRVPHGKRPFSYKIPASVIPGNYYIVVGNSKIAAISSGFAIQKPSQQTLNRTRLRTKAAPIKPKPDLIIEKIEVSDRTPPYNKIRSRDELHFLVTVKNIGTQSCVNEFYVGFSHWGCDTNTWKWQEVQLDPLDRGATTLKIIQVRAHSLPNGWKENPNLCIKVDVRNQVGESREYNNIKSLKIIVEDN